MIYEALFPKQRYTVRYTYIHLDHGFKIIFFNVKRILAND